ncbi:MAG TPA: hypothetical protein VD908_07955, partial [Cytophagales bacterium]|nr:hypothetical protein [Cytophagales bacterium]
MKKRTQTIIYVLVVLSLSFQVYSECPTNTPTSLPAQGCPGPGFLTAQSNYEVGVTHKWFDANGSPVTITSQGRPNSNATVYVSRIDFSKYTPGIYNFSVAEVKNNCVGPKRSVTYTVLATPIPNISTQNGNPTAVCEGALPGFLLKGSGGTSYKWVLNGGIVSEEKEFSPTSSGRYYLIVSNICGTSGSTQKYIDVTIKPNTPTAPVFTQAQTTVCKGEITSTYKVTSSNTEAYTWSISPSAAGTIASTGNTADVTWKSAYSGNAQIVATAYGCSDNTTSIS